MNEKKIDVDRAKFIIFPIIARSKIILDIGVNKGKEIASFFKYSPDAHVFGFEPHHGLFKRLRKRMGPLFSSCTFYNMAVSDRDGKQIFIWMYLIRILHL